MPDQVKAKRDDLVAAKWLVRAVAGSAFALTVLLGSQAMAADEPEEESFEEKFMNNLLGNNKPIIDYRERSPLVVPPTTSYLPAPEQPVQTVTHPAWPKDAENKARKAKRADRYELNKYKDGSGRALMPNEMAGRGPAGSGSGPDSRQNTEAASGRALSPTELGASKNVFGSIFSSKDQTETAVFAGEPERSSLTEPPRGYMTPSPNYPYGLGAAKQAPKPLSTTLDERAVGR